MKRLIAFLSVLLCAPAYADGFGVNDKVLYFNSNVLIDVIKNTFPQNLQLDVANKYVELMDKSGNVSIADLITVCGVGNLDNAKCRNFINDLITAMGDDTIKPFYWADYVSANPEPIRLQTYSSGDGYHKNPGLVAGEWAMTFGWMKDSKFIKQYPQTKYIRGHSACTADAGTPYTIDAGKNYALNETGGEHCWCKMAGPEESPWVYNKSGDTMAGGCDRSCALECLSALRAEPMRAAMFSVVKLNGTNANTSDEKVIGDALVAAVTPPPPPKPKTCEFDWATDTKYVDNIKKRFRIHTPTSYPGFDWEVFDLNWLKSDKFLCRYPNVSSIKGIAECHHEDYEPATCGPVDIEFTTPASDMGGKCWCKMTYPEESKWFHVGFNPDGYACEYDCPEFCATVFITQDDYDQCGFWILEPIGKK